MRFALSKMMLALSLPLALAASLWGADMPAAAEGPGWMQSGEEITRLVEGRTHVRERNDGQVEVEYHSPDGRVAYEYEGCLISGRWWLEQNVLCYAYPEMTGDLPHCFWLRQVRGQLEYWSVDTPQANQPIAVTTDNLPGNTQQLPLDASGRCTDI